MLVEFFCQYQKILGHRKYNDFLLKVDNYFIKKEQSAKANILVTNNSSKVLVGRSGLVSSRVIGSHKKVISQLKHIRAIKVK